MRRRSFPAAVVIVLATALLRGTAQAPRLPDRDSFLAETRKRLASNALLQSRYTYRERVSELNLNPFGRMGTGPMELYEVYPIDDGLVYRRLIERNGAPVPRAEVLEEDRKFIARYEEWRRQLAREGTDERAARLKRQEAARAKDRRQAREALDLFIFALERRETVEGHPAVGVSFKPKPAANPQSREARVASNFSGIAWVHEHQFEVIRVEATAINDTPFGYGVVARLYKGATANFQRRPIGGDWLPVETRFNGTGRALLFRKVTINYVREYLDYRPFDPVNFRAMLGDATSSR